MSRPRERPLITVPGRIRLPANPSDVPFFPVHPRSSCASGSVNYLGNRTSVGRRQYGRLSGQYWSSNPTPITVPSPEEYAVQTLITSGRCQPDDSDSAILLPELRLLFSGGHRSRSSKRLPDSQSKLRSIQSQAESRRRAIGSGGKWSSSQLIDYRISDSDGKEWAFHQIPCPPRPEQVKDRRREGGRKKKIQRQTCCANKLSSMCAFDEHVRP